MSGVLLVEQNGHRLVHLPQEDAILCEFLSKDSLGADTWKMLRKIPRMASTGFNGPVKENLLYHFFLEMYEEGYESTVPAERYHRRLEEL